MVEMTSEAITARLETLARLFSPDAKATAVDMGAEAIGARLRELSELSRLCAALSRIGPGRRSDH